MAKSKAKSKDHDEELPEEIKEAADEVVKDADVDELEDADVDEVEDVDAEPVEDIEDVEDVDAAVADEEDLDDVKAKATDDDDDGPHDSVDETPKPPKPKARLTKTTIALILLNLVMAPVFLVVVWMDYRVRMEYAYRTVLNYVQMIGLPLRQEEDDASLATETRPPIRLSREMITADYTKRPGVNKSIKDFATVEEPIPFRLRPSDMDETMMKDVFRDLPNPVRTQDEEIERLKTALPKQIADAADEVLKKQKDDAEKRALVQKTLYPIIGDTRWKGPRRERYAALHLGNRQGQRSRCKKPPAPSWTTWSRTQSSRRIYWDILAPINIFRPGDPATTQIEKMGDLTVTISDIKGFLLARLNASIAETYDNKVHIGPAFAKGVKRDSVEKRRKIAFILFTLGQVEKPGLNEKLVKKGVERAQTISGLYEFTNATIDFVKAVRVLDEPSGIRNQRRSERRFDFQAEGWADHANRGLHRPV